MADPVSSSLRVIRALKQPRGVIRAFHGSPHSFTRFDASKIGTGEGAQAYGHGLYFAGNEGVAQAYRDGFSGALLVDGEPASLTPSQGVWARWILDGKAEEQAAAYQAVLDAASRKRQELKAMQAADPVLFADTPGNISSLGEFSYQADMAADELEAYRSLVGRNLGRSKAHMYEVEIGYPESSLLDWDGSLPQQPEAVHAYVGRTGIAADGSMAGRLGGQKLWWRRRTSLGPQEAARELVEAGIPGIKYYDALSRRADQGTRNYVMFPGTEDRIRILRQYGLIPPMAAGLMQDEEQ